MIAVFKREIRSYFQSILGYLFIAFVLVFAGIYTMAYNLSGYYSNFEYVLDSIGFIYLIAVPVLTMRSVAEEKRQKTDQLLYSLPLTLTEVIFGKYLAMLVVLLIPCVIMAFYPVILSNFGTVVYSTAYSTLIAFFCLGATLLSIGLFVSSVTENQVAAAVITLVITLIAYFLSSLANFVPSTAAASRNALYIIALIFGIIVYFLSKNPIIAFLTAAAGIGGIYLWYSIDSSAFRGLFGSIMTELSFFDRYYTFVNGVFDLTAIIYYISIIAVFLFMSVQALEKRRWSE